MHKDGQHSHVELISKDISEETEAERLRLCEILQDVGRQKDWSRLHITRKVAKALLGQAPPKQAMKVRRLSATVMLMFFVGAASSPAGISSSSKGIMVPDQLLAKMKKRMVMMKGTRSL